MSKRPGSEITSFEIPEWMDDFIQSEAIPQANYRSNPLNQGGLAPKIVDPFTPGRSYELKYNSGYTEAHDRVDWRWSGNPWEADQ